MRRHIASLALMTMVAVGCADQRQNNANIDVNADGVIGGKLILEDSRVSKWVVAIKAFTEINVKEGKDDVMYTDVKECTGSMIAEDVVLTAAHCVPRNAELVVTFSPMANDGQAVHIKVKKYIIHSNFRATPSLNYKKMDEDIALLKLESKKPAQYEILGLTDDFPHLKNSFSFMAIGYGLNDAEVTGFVHSALATGASFDPRLNYFIADQRNGKGVCPGDSGGPAIVTKENRNFVIGVAQAVFSTKGNNAKDSSVEKCKQQAIYTSVQYYRQWILAGIKSLR